MRGPRLSAAMSSAATAHAATPGTPSAGSRTGGQLKRRIGPAWTERGRPSAGYYTKRTAETWLDGVLAEARRGTLPAMVRTGATFADAAAEYMRWLEHDRQCKPSTLRDYNSIITAHLLPAFSNDRLEDITAEQVEGWSASLAATGRMNNRTRLKILTALHGVMQRAKRVWKLAHNPTSEVENQHNGGAPRSRSSPRRTL
jgi:hypothetical protein